MGWIRSLGSSCPLPLIMVPVVYIWNVLWSPQNGDLKPDRRVVWRHNDGTVCRVAALFGTSPRGVHIRGSSIPPIFTVYNKYLNSPFNLPGTLLRALNIFNEVLVKLWCLSNVGRFTHLFSSIPWKIFFPCFSIPL